MKDARLDAWIRSKFLGLHNRLAECARRRWAAVEALSLGHGGVTAVAAATGIARSTIHRGLAELDAPTPATDRQRRPGTGRKPTAVTDPGLAATLDAIVEPDTRGTPLRWTGRSIRQLAKALTAKRHRVGSTTVRRLLKAAGYSLQANCK